MIEIKGMPPNMNAATLRRELDRGARFVQYQYCVSIILMTFKRGTDLYYIPPGESAVVKGLPWTFLSLVLGWWGIPWGPIYTIGSLASNLTGGKDLTNDIGAHLISTAAEEQALTTIDATGTAQ
ncbi:MAG: hypothetical protein H6585_11935 [Flavobacteriales bacterium]|nr:hypothetical protein [Flavobacteriales bacterium]MCB9449040.1 hypothetical protein [Flavobacteriales bacterium]